MRYQRADRADCAAPRRVADRPIYGAGSRGGGTCADPHEPGSCAAGGARGKAVGRWAGATVVCIASGPSLSDADVERVQNWRRQDPQSRRVIVGNTSFRNAPWADALYANDLRWFGRYGEECERTFTGEVWTCSREMDGINYIEAADDVGLCTKPGRIHSGGNTGYGMVGLAYTWGARRIVLLGYDMQAGPKGELHHHGRHDAGLPNPTPENFREWRRRMIEIGADLRREGVEVINATRRTALVCFEQMQLEDALCCGDAPRVVSGNGAALLIREDLLPREHEAFTKGLAAAGYRMSSKPDVSVVWGTYKGKAEGTVLVAENGYLRGAGGPHVALAVGGHNGAGWWSSAGRERFDGLGIAVRRWRDNGSHVLVCPSRGIGQNPQPKDWTEKTVARLKKLTDREIRVRAHPGNWKALPEHPDADLARDLDGAWACVIWASTAGLRALINGVPVIRTAPHWIAADAAGDDLAQIESPPMPDRMPVFHRIAWAQWSLEEIASGYAL
jgi:hypothetical protein